MSKAFIFNRSIITLLAGYAIEKYDMFLYGFFTIIIGELFFPTADTSISTPIIFSLGIFAAGYVMRPVGGLFFGHLGDKFGRKKALLVSIGMAVLPPLILSFLPTYNQVGIFAPVVLLICRLFQGFCSGAEFSGASVFLQERSAENEIAYSVSLLRSVGFLGVALGTAIAYLSTLPFMPAWGWRIPFVIGAVLTVILYFARAKGMQESLLFERAKEKGKIVNFPFVALFKNSKRRLACAMALTVYASCAFYMSTVYVNTLLKTEFNLPNHQILAINTGIILFWALAIPMLGIWADKCGINNFIIKSISWNILLTYPLFWFLEKYFSLTNFIFFQIIFGLLCASFYVPFAALIPKIFRVEERYSGVAFSITFIQAILGGITPLISTLLVSLTGDKKAPAYILVIGAFIAFMGVIKIQKFLIDTDDSLHSEIIHSSRTAAV